MPNESLELVEQCRMYVGLGKFGFLVQFSSQSTDRMRFSSRQKLNFDFYLFQGVVLRTYPYGFWTMFWCCFQEKIPKNSKSSITTWRWGFIEFCRKIFMKKAAILKVFWWVKYQKKVRNLMWFLDVEIGLIWWGWGWVQNENFCFSRFVKNFIVSFEMWNVVYLKEGDGFEGCGI